MATAPVFNLRVDNDLFAGDDHGYTSGVQLTAVSPDLSRLAGRESLPGLPRWLGDRLGFLHGADPATEQRNLVLRIEQRIYTPEDPTGRT